MTTKENPKPAGRKPAAKAAPKAAPKDNPGERIAKVLSRAGVASRREAERMIELGQVSVNGKIIDSPALNVTDTDRIVVNGQPLAAAEPARLWLYYKPDGLVTSNSDEKGRETIFDHLPEDLPRVMTIGRLDLNSEGLLLLTNDGELKRRLELPSTGWLRKYRVRVNGNPTDVDLEPLRRGITVEGERFQPMLVVLDRIQGANAWLTVGLREGKNREIRRAMAAVNLTVNRLIRVSYGPFRLGDMEPGAVEEVRGKVLRDQLGEGPTVDDADKPAGRVRTTSATKPARSRNTDGKPMLKPGAGLRAMSDAWTEAVTPKPAGGRPKPMTRKPRDADTSDPAKKAHFKPGDKLGNRAPAAKPTRSATAKPAGKPTGKPAPRPASKPTGDRPAPRGKPAPKGRRGE